MRNEKTNLSSILQTIYDDGGEIVIEKLGSDKASLVKNKIPKTMDYLIYDGGGFVDDLSLKFLLNSDFIIIPSNLENRSLRSARKVINELIQNHRVNSNKIIVVINRYKENPKSDDEKRIVQSIFPEIKSIIYIRETKILENMINENLNFDDFKGKYPSPLPHPTSAPDIVTGKQIGRASRRERV